MVDSGKVPHAIMFHEDDGGGGVPIALAFLQYLFCKDKAGGDSCGACPSCNKISKLIHPDVHFIYPVNTGASTDFAAQWRELVLSNPVFTENDLREALGIEGKNAMIKVDEAKTVLDILSLYALERGYRALVMYLPEKMNKEAANRLLKAVEEHNEVCRLIREIGEFRKEDDPRITGYEFHVITLATYLAPKHLLIDKLRETLEELRTREPDGKKWRARVLVVGSEIDDIGMIKLIEECGTYVCADRFCFGSFPGREPIEIDPDSEDDVLTQICRHYVMRCQCPRYMDNPRIAARKKYMYDLAREYHADGVVVQQMNFCNFWPYERAAMAHILPEEYGWPVLSVDRPYIVGASGQMRTRIQAFVESIEIKKIRGGAD